MSDPYTKPTPEELAEFHAMREAALAHKRENEYWVFLVSSYFATGEGNTVCLLMTQASRCKIEDFDEGTLITTKEFRAKRRFAELFGDFYAEFSETISREEFFSRYSDYLPERLKSLESMLCNVEYHSELHYNFS
jgi:hypothetical protein